MIAPYDSTRPEIFDKVWEYDLNNGTVAVGWNALGDISGLSKSDVESRFALVYGKRSARDINAIWRFHHEIAPDDVMVARRGRKRIIGIGTVTGPPFYDQVAGAARVGHSRDDPYSNFLPVRWEEKNIEFDRMRFAFQTLYEIDAGKYQHLVEGKEDEEEKVPEQSTEFVLEKYLEDFLVTNFDRVFSGSLQLHPHDDGTTGQQYVTGVGNIDILAREPDTGAYVIIELKKGRPSDEVVGQILRYMGWVKENLCEADEEVKGLVICREPDERLEYALNLVGHLIRVQFYEVDFRLKDSK